MNTTILASEKTLLDWYAGQETLAEFDHPEASYGDKLATAFAGPKPQGGWAEDPHGMFEWEARVRAGMKYTRATAMLAEKARREATGKDSLTVQTREVDDDYWAKFQDGIIITFEPTMGWCASIREGSLGSGNTIAEAVANLRTMWEERSAAPVVQESSTTESYITDKNGIPVARVTHAPISDHSPDAMKMIELEAANRELVEALEATVEFTDGLYAPHGSVLRDELVKATEKARAILAKHKGAK